MSDYQEPSITYGVSMVTPPGGMTLDPYDLLDKYAPHNRASVGTQLVAVQRILQDLIAELRATAFSQDWATWRLLMEIVEGAEARLAAQE